MAVRKKGSRIKLSPKALKQRPDLRGEIGIITYGPTPARNIGDKRWRMMYTVQFKNGNSPRTFGVFPDQITSV
jgi:hypothetical protein